MFYQNYIRHYRWKKHRKDILKSRFYAFVFFLSMTYMMSIAIPVSCYGTEIKEICIHLKKYRWGLPVIIIFIAGIIFLVIRVKRSKGKTPKGFGKNTKGQMEDSEITLMDEADEELKLIVYRRGRRIAVFQTRIDESIIVGRSDYSDIYIEDEQLSRQHFAIEYDGEHYYIEDLETTNGTMVNGMRIDGKRRLDRNDKIKAGSLEMVIRW